MPGNLPYLSRLLRALFFTNFSQAVIYYVINSRTITRTRHGESLILHHTSPFVFVHRTLPPHTITRCLPLPFHPYLPISSTPSLRPHSMSSHSTLSLLHEVVSGGSGVSCVGSPGSTARPARLCPPCDELPAPLPAPLLAGTSPSPALAQPARHFRTRGVARRGAGPTKQHIAAPRHHIVWGKSFRPLLINEDLSCAGNVHSRNNTLDNNKPRRAAGRQHSYSVRCCSLQTNAVKDCTATVAERKPKHGARFKIDAKLREPPARYIG